MQLLKMSFIHHVSPLIRRIFPLEQCSMNSPCLLMPEGGVLLNPQKIFDYYRLSLIISVIYWQEEQYLFILLMWFQKWHLPGSVMRAYRWVIAKSTHETATSVTQCVIDLRLGKQTITNRAQTQVRCLQHVLSVFMRTAFVLHWTTYVRPHVLFRNH